MSWKSIVITGLLCVVASPVLAVPALSVTSSYNAALDVIEWQVNVTGHGATSLAIEAPFTLAPDTTGFGVGLRGNSSTSETTHSAGDNNGTGAQTWYYNVDTNGTTKLWNTQNDAADIEQNPGDNPFTAPTRTEGLWLDTAGSRLFAALGSDIALPAPLKTLHIASNDGILNWAGLELYEAGSLAATLTSSFSSIRKADMNADGVVNGLDVTPFVQALTNLPAYNAALPGLDGVARADINNDGVANGLDVSPFVTCVTGGGCAPGSGSGEVGSLSSAAVPEPSTVLMVVAGLTLCGFCRRSR